MIQVFSPDTIARHMPGNPADDVIITFYRSGRIRLSNALAHRMQVKGGDHVVIIRLDDRLFIARAREGKGWSLKDGSAPCLYSIGMVKWVGEFLGIPFEKVSRMKYRISLVPEKVNDFHAYQILPHESDPA